MVVNFDLSNVLEFMLHTDGSTQYTLIRHVLMDNLNNLTNIENKFMSKILVELELLASIENDNTVMQLPVANSRSNFILSIDNIHGIYRLIPSNESNISKIAMDIEDYIKYLDNPIEVSLYVNYIPLNYNTGKLTDKEMLIDNKPIYINKYNEGQLVYKNKISKYVLDYRSIDLNIVNSSKLKLELNDG